MFLRAPFLPRHLPVAFFFEVDFAKRVSLSLFPIPISKAKGKKEKAKLFLSKSIEGGIEKSGLKANKMEAREQQQHVCTFLFLARPISTVKVFRPRFRFSRFVCVCVTYGVR